MNIGIDIGTSIAKGVLLEKNKLKNKVSIKTGEIKTTILQIVENLLEKKETSKKFVNFIAITGGKSRNIKNRINNLPLRKVDEIKAIGLGGLITAKKNNGLIVSVGTGTALVTAYNNGEKISHIGGIGVGGGTITGLAKGILGLENFREIENLALSGKTEKVDLTVAEVVGGPIGIIPEKATASNLAKLSKYSKPEDVAAGIFNMVSQTIGIVSVMAAKAYNLEKNIIFVGRLPTSRLINKILNEISDLFKVEICIPRNAEYSTAYGAAYSITSN